MARGKRASEADICLNTCYTWLVFKNKSFRAQHDTFQFREAIFFSLKSKHMTDHKLKLVIIIGMNKEGDVIIPESLSMEHKISKKKKKGKRIKKSQLNYNWIMNGER